VRDRNGSRRLLGSYAYPSVTSAKAGAWVGAAIGVGGAVSGTGAPVVAAGLGDSFAVPLA